MTLPPTGRTRHASARRVGRSGGQQGPCGARGREGHRHGGRPGNLTDARGSMAPPASARPEGGAGVVAERRPRSRRAKRGCVAEARRHDACPDWRPTRLPCGRPPCRWPARPAPHGPCCPQRPTHSCALVWHVRTARRQRLIRPSNDMMRWTKALLASRAPARGSSCREVAERPSGRVFAPGVGPCGVPPSPFPTRLRPSPSSGPGS